MKYDCLFVGNAIVDILTDVSFEFINDQGIEPGSWRPVEKEEIEKLQSIIPDNKVASGGSAANSAVVPDHRRGRVGRDRFRRAGGVHCGSP